MLIAAAITGLLGGCASTGDSNSPQDAKAASDSAAARADAMRKMVAARSEARWQALIKGDLDGAYMYLSAGSKAATSVDAYKRKTGGLAWRRIEVEKVECDGEICTVALVLTYDTDRMKGIKTPINERWIIENGSAWFIYG